MTVATIVQVATVLISVFGVIMALRKGNREEKRTEVANLVERVRRLEVKARVLDDYCNALRGDLRAQGLVVRDWPDELTEGGV